MITFTVSEVTPGATMLPQTTLASALRARLGCDAEAFASTHECLVDTTLHGLVGAAHHAFTEHHPLVLSPDDIWLCIAQGFSQHVDMHAEALRSKFVQNSQRATIVVTRDEFKKGSPANDWPGCFAEFSDQIAQHIGEKRELVVANFSTTGKIEKAASEIVLMAALRHYFDYILVTLCGIPNITLLGTTSDWALIRQRAEALEEFDAQWWITRLLPVLDQFVAAASGHVDQEFWRSFYKWNDYSGGPYVSGWINTLFPYIEDEKNGAPALVQNKYVTTWDKTYHSMVGSGPNANQFPSGLAIAPFLWKYLGSNIPMELIGGFVGVSQDAGTLAVRAAIGWAVREEVAR